MDANLGAEALELTAGASPDDSSGKIWAMAPNETALMLEQERQSLITIMRAEEAQQAQD